MNISMKEDTTITFLPNINSTSYSPTYVLFIRNVVKGKETKRLGPKFPNPWAPGVLGIVVQIGDERPFLGNFGV